MNVNGLLNRYFSRLLWFDVRSLAVFRISLGILILLDLWVRSADMVLFYTDDGMLSAARIFPRYWSIHAWSGSVEWIQFLFMLQAALALAVIIGWRTRWTLLLTAILMISLNMRNPALNNAGDQLLRLVLVMSLFLPLDKCFTYRNWSFKIREGQQENYQCYSSWIFAYMLQLILVYSISGFSKNNETWNTGYGLHYAMHLHTYAKGSAQTLLQFPVLLKMLNYYVLMIERFGWILLMVPVHVQSIRLVLVVVFSSFHIGLIFFMELGMFPWIGVLVWLPLIPSAFWEWVMRWNTWQISFKKPVKIDIRKENKWKYSLLFSFLFIMIYDNVTKRKEIPKVRWVESVMRQTKLTQGWGLFSGPKKFDGWVVTEAILKNGSKIDLMRDGADYTEVRPEVVSAQYENHRYRKFIKGIRKSYAAYRLDYLKCLVRQWNEHHDEQSQVEAVTLYLLKQDILKEGGYGPVERQKLTSI